MAEEVTSSAATTSAVTVSSGTVPAGAQGDAAPAATYTPPTPAGEPRRESVTERPEQPEPAKPASGTFKDLAEAERQYKEVLAWNTRVSQKLARLAPDGNLDAVADRLQQLDQLRGDPRFQKWAQATLAEMQAGASDPETVKALQLVHRIATERAQQIVAPLMERDFKLRVNEAFSDMDKKYGPDGAGEPAAWRKYNLQMRDLLYQRIQQGVLAPQADQNPSPELLEDLYLAVRGRDPAYAESQYRKTLAEKQAQTSVSQPGPAQSAVGAPPVRTMREAAALARKQLGMT